MESTINANKIDWERTTTLSNLEYHNDVNVINNSSSNNNVSNNNNINNNNINNINDDSRWSAMDSDEELEESNFNWCICLTRSIAIALIVIIIVLMCLKKFFPRIFWLAGFVTAFLICLLLMSFLPWTKCMKKHVISTYSVTNGLKEIIIGGTTNTPTNSDSNNSIISDTTNKSNLKTKLLPIMKKK